MTPASGPPAGVGLPDAPGSPAGVGPLAEPGLPAEPSPHAARDGVDRGVLAGLVLAAGSGSRLGQPKALVRLDGELLVERACRVLAGGGAATLVVVLGAAADEVRRQARLPAGAVVVDNPDWPSGMGSSLRAGLAALPAAAGAVVVALVDQPLVRPEAVRRLAAAWRAGAVAAVATYGGQPRNPVLLTRPILGEVAEAATGDRGARAWLRAHPTLVQQVTCDDAGDPTDIDTPAELSALTGVSQAPAVPAVKKE
jgi:CTP:molybdopterin cytidylyltransferase MocA